MQQLLSWESAKHPSEVGVAPETRTLAVSVTVEQLCIGLGFYLWRFQFTWERSGASVFQLCKNFAAQWASKARIFPNTSWEEAGVFTGNSRACLPLSFMALGGSPASVKGTGSGSHSAILLAEGPFWVPSGADLLLILGEGDESQQ